MSTDIVDKALDKASNYKTNQDDDFTDRLNYIYTSIIFGVCAIAIGAKQFFGQPISCFFPPEYADTWDDYTLDFCYIQNTYFVSMEEKFPPASERADREVPLYQWVAFILGGMLFSTLLPKIFMGSFNLKTGLSIQTIAAAEELDEKKIKQKARCFVRALKYQQHSLPSADRNNLLGNLNSSLHKSTITRTYLLFKVWNTLNSLAQLYFVNQYIAPKFGAGIWGYDIIRSWADYHAWKKTGHFPRVSFCDVTYRSISTDPITYTVQCTLMINLLNEKIFIFIWFWLFFLSILNIINLVTWLFYTYSNASLDHFVKRKLVLKDVVITDRNVRDFVSNFLYVDGVTCIRLVELNSGVVAAASILTIAYEAYLKKNERSMEVASISNNSKHNFPLEDLYIDN